jgi:hypothetical protein
VAQEADTNEQSANQQPRCEIDKVEVQLDGRLLCVSHAELLRLKNRSETKLGTVFEMDQWLESVDGEADELRVRRIEHQRKEVVEQLRFDRLRIGFLRGELLKDQDGTT